MHVAPRAFSVLVIELLVIEFGPRLLAALRLLGVVDGM
jgi:hypothetical protein